MSGSSAINVAKLQEQLAKNVTVYTTGSGSTQNTANVATDDSVRTLLLRN